jgi:hypothetical protein
LKKDRAMPSIGLNSSGLFSSPSNSLSIFQIK